jgi:AraC family transcriptional regulator of adaptative response / DNA-3-methyladenine glycosylase II
MTAFLAGRAISGVEAVSERRYARTLTVEDASGIVIVEPGEGDFLRVTVHFPTLQALPAVIARVRRVFDLAADPSVIGAHLSEDPRLAPLVAARPGLRAPGAWDGFELAVRAVLGQQITVQAARTLAGKLTAAYGERLQTAAGAALGLTHLFPTPERLVGRDIAAIGMPQARGAALGGLAQAASADPLLFSARRSLEEAIERLRALPGIGEWTAQYIALRAMREPDAFPPADVGLMRALTDAEGRRPTPSELLSTAERWRPWRAYAAQHLWASDPTPASSKEKTHDRQAA